MSTLTAQQLEACLELAVSDTNLGKRVKEALDVIYDILDTYGEEHVSLSFNGGKDCTVLLHLYAAALYGRRRKNVRFRTTTVANSTAHPSMQFHIPSIYIAPPSPFEELEAFIRASELRYNLSLYRIPSPAAQNVEKGGEGMRRALELYKREFPGIEAVLIGTRRSDPHGGNLSYKNPTDGDWPKFMRGHPVVNWSYSDIWDFLRRLDVPYCKLYDAGYTSLGSTYNTLPNPALRQPKADHSTDQSEQSPYLPAYELQNATLERAGRGSLSPSVEVHSSALPSPAVELTHPVLAAPSV